MSNGERKLLHYSFMSVNVFLILHISPRSVRSRSAIYIYVTGHGKRAHFVHYFKIELLVFKGSVDLKQ